MGHKTYGEQAELADPLNPNPPRVVSRSCVAAATQEAPTSDLEDLAATPMAAVQIQVIIPPGVMPGQQLLVQNPYGGQVQVIVPQGVQPGQAILVQAPMMVAPPQAPAYPQQPPHQPQPPRPPQPSQPPRPQVEPPRQPSYEPPNARSQQLERARFMRMRQQSKTPPTTVSIATPWFALCSSSSGGASRCL